MKQITKEQWAKCPKDYKVIKNGQRYMLTNENGATVLAPVEIDKGMPEPGKQYALTGGTGTPSIVNGNTWAESEVRATDNLALATLTGQPMTKEMIASQVKKYLEVVNELIAEYWSDVKITHEAQPMATVEWGSRYAKVIGGRSVHTFIDIKNGNILKAATYRAPARNGVRGNIFAKDCGRSVITNHGAKYLK
jgi:hypothetical protein